VRDKQELKMKKIECIIRSEKLKDVTDALKKIERRR
jgi:nitrogen regulatory protein PII